MNTPAKTFAYVFGAVYLIVGIVGFAVTGFSDFASAEGDLLIVFELNPLHNIVHLLIGIALLAAAGAGEVTSRQITLLVGAVYAIVGVLGFFIIGNDTLNILALNLADNLLHIGTAIVAFLAASASGRTVVTA